MDKAEFIKNFANQFEETNLDQISFETRFRDLDEWCSLIAFAVLNMIDSKYKVHIKAEDFINLNTINELYDYVNIRKK